MAAAAPDVSHALDGVANRYNRPRTMELRFRQTFTFPGRPADTESGELYLRKPRRMRWEYDEPAGKLFLIDGKYVYLYAPATRRVQKSLLKESDDVRAPLAFLIGQVDLRRDFREFRSHPEGDDLYIQALPTSKKSPYQEVEFLVTPEYRIKRLVIHYVNRSVSEFEFSDEKINPRLAPDLFVFRMPEGARLVEMADMDDGSN